MKNINIYKIKNEFLEVELLNLGAIIKSIKFLKSKNIDNNLVLSFDNLEYYRINNCYIGATIGRTAGRIKDGILKIDDKIYHLTKNSKNSNLHGGKFSISHRFFEVEEKESDYIVFKIFDSENNNGYPANVEIKVKYSLKDNIFSIEYFAVSDKKTYINLTSHSYFNFNLDKNSTIYNHYLKINSDYMLAIDENSIPVNTFKLKNSIFDFKNFTLIGDFFKNDEENEQKKLANGIDHPYVLNSSEACSLKYDDIKMSIKTSSPCMVVYTANYLSDCGFNNRTAICFETQEAPNLFEEKSLNLKATFTDKNYYQRTDFIFEKI